MHSLTDKFRSMIELSNKNISNREENKLIEKKEDLDSPEFKDDCVSIASTISSNKSSKSFQSRLREKFVFSKSNSDEVGHKALEIDLENKNLKIENLEKELGFKNKKIEDLELEKNRLLDGILEMNNEMLLKLKTKLAEKEFGLSQINDQRLDQEEISCIKSLLQSQKESIIQSCMEIYDDLERKLGKWLDIKEEKITSLEAELRLKKNEIEEQPKMVDNGTNRNLDTSGTQQNDDDRKIFAGGLAQEATEKDITEYFCKFGEVASVNLKVDQMNRSRGFAFVVFVEVETLTAVLSKDHHFIKGKKVSVKKAVPNSKQGKIYIGKFKDPTISEDVILEHFTQYGQVVEIQRPVDHNKNSEPKNFCFVTFDKEEPANALIKKGTVVVNGQEVEIKKLSKPAPFDLAPPYNPPPLALIPKSMDRGGMRGGCGGRGGCWMGGYGGGGDWGYGGGWVAEAYGPPGPWGGYSGSWGDGWFGHSYGRGGMMQGGTGGF